MEKLSKSEDGRYINVCRNMNYYRKSDCYYWSNGCRTVICPYYHMGMREKNEVREICPLYILKGHCDDMNICEFIHISPEDIYGYTLLSRNTHPILFNSSGDIRCLNNNIINIIMEMVMTTIDDFRDLNVTSKFFNAYCKKNRKKYMYKLGKNMSGYILFPNGIKHGKETIIDNWRNILERKYYNEGNLTAIVHKNISTREITSKCSYLKGVKHGDEITFYRSGLPHKHTEWDAGNKIRETVYSDLGEEISIINYSQGDNLVMIGPYKRVMNKKDMNQMKNEFYYPDGSRLCTITGAYTLEYGVKISIWDENGIQLVFVHEDPPYTSEAFVEAYLSKIIGKSITL